MVIFMGQKSQNRIISFKSGKKINIYYMIIQWFFLNLFEKYYLDILIILYVTMIVQKIFIK